MVFINYYKKFALRRTAVSSVGIANLCSRNKNLFEPLFFALWEAGYFNSLKKINESQGLSAPQEMRMACSYLLYHDSSFKNTMVHRDSMNASLRQRRYNHLRSLYHSYDKHTLFNDNFTL